MERNSSRSMKNEREEVSRRQSRASPAACDEDDGEVAVTLQPMEVHGGAETHVQPVENPVPEQVDVPKGGCVESLSWSRLPGRIHGERSLCWSRSGGRTCDPARDTLWNNLFLKGFTP